MDFKRGIPPTFSRRRVEVLNRHGRCSPRSWRGVQWPEEN